MMSDDHLMIVISCYDRKKIAINHNC